MIGVILWIALALGCFSLAAKGLSGVGLPLTRGKNITGIPAKIIGVICVILGLACVGNLLFML